MSMRSSSPGARVCHRCGALNSRDFDRCIRCGAALSSGATWLDRVGAHLDGHSLLATKALLALTCLVFALQLRAEGSLDGFLLGSGRSAIRLGAYYPGFADEPWRLLSAVFVHFGVIHIGMNMLSLMNLARVAEPAVGSARFLIAYVAAGIVGFAVPILVSLFFGLLGVAVPSFLASGPTGPTAGASGAVLGIMGVILGWLMRRRDPRWKSFAVQAIFYGVLFGFMLNRTGSIFVNNAAHIGGLLSGLAFGWLVAPTVYSQKKARAATPIIVVLGAEFVLLAVWFFILA
jgi:membrane associated rhomboid family serine protease